MAFSCTMDGAESKSTSATILGSRVMSCTTKLSEDTLRRLMASAG
jgi:hypothetical protein